MLIGIRRCGKSVILKQIANEIETDDAHKIFINFEDLEFNALQDELTLYNYVKALITDEKKYYLFLMKFKMFRILKRQLIPSDY